MPTENYKLNTCVQCATEFKSHRVRKYCCKQCKSKAESDSRTYSAEELARRADRQRERREAFTPEQKAAVANACKAYVALHQESVRKNKREYYQANVEKIKQLNAERYQDPAVAQETKARSQQWRKSNPERKAIANKEWADANRDRMARYFAASKAKRRANPLHRMYDSIGAQMRQALNGKKNGKQWEGIVGYTRTDLAQHLERQFTRGMSWTNYGTAWHIDHIVPQVEFLIEQEGQVKACWALSNLRPLWSVQNLSKGARRTHLL